MRPLTGWSRAGLWLLAGLAAFAALSLPRAEAQQPAARVDVTATRVDGDQLTVAVAVLDAASNPIGGLTLEAFGTSVDGAALTPASVTSGVDAALPLGIILTVDTSGSMLGAAITSAKQAILPLVGALQSGDQAALLTFAQSVTLAVPLTGETGTLTAAIQAMAATGNTALFAGVTRAAELAAAAPQPRRAVVLLSDGEDFGAASGGLTRDQAIEAARASGVPFFDVGLGQEVDQQFLTSLASTTGGLYFAAARPGPIEPALQPHLRPPAPAVHHQPAASRRAGRRIPPAHRLRCRRDRSRHLRNGGPAAGAGQAQPDSHRAV